MAASEIINNAPTISMMPIKRDIIESTALKSPAIPPKEKSSETAEETSSTARQISSSIISGYKVIPQATAP